MAFVGAAFGQGSGEIFLEEVECDGTETTLDDCLSGVVSNCSHVEDAGVRCMGKMSDAFSFVLENWYC